MDDHDDRVRKRAHDIWEAEGRPEGREYSHWLRARTEINEEDAAAASAGNGERADQRPVKKLASASETDIALNTLPPGTVLENPTAENPARLATARPAKPTMRQDGARLGKTF